MGLRPDTEVNLTNNEIVVLSEENFRPMLNILSKGDGILHLDDISKCDPGTEISNASCMGNGVCCIVKIVSQNFASFQPSGSKGNVPNDNSSSSHLQGVDA
ncbi:unnamed protein product, partial [Darwinula stevensoni]